MDFCKKITLICMLLLCICLAGCTGGEKTSTKIQMGTYIKQITEGKNSSSAQKDVDDELSLLNSIFSVNISESEISKLNSNSGSGEFVFLSEDMIRVLKTAKEISNESGEAFNPVILPLVRLWGIGTKNAKVPEKTEILETLPYLSSDFLQINEQNLSARLTKKGALVDLGGIAKGYAADKCAEIYKKHKVWGVISIGGNTITVCNKSPYKIGIRNPKGGETDIIGYVLSYNNSVVTSGGYERYFESGGKTYHHILNSKTGYPAESDLLSVTVIGDSSTLCDALSTALFAMGYDRGKEYIKNYSGYGAVFIKKSSEIITTENISDIFYLKDAEGFTYEKK